ncbi:hypothetical protein S40293_03415 [Stachybotrys chartarum IBT 40293]|nr:hypothetical protein S40293_03415 [Stachybotrys chartarum IBT 40293]
MSPPVETYDIDGLGDVLLVLLPGDPRETVTDQDDISEPDTCFDDASSLDTLISDGMLAGAAETQQGNAGRAIRRAVRFRVASHHLRRSSPVFKELLDRYIGYPGAAYLLHYPIRIPMWNDDPAVMALILRIIHEDALQAVADQEVQQLFPTAENYMDQINLPTLARIATIAQKYQLEPVVDYCLTKWIDKLWVDMNGSSIDEAVAWVWVTWVFELADHFAAATKYLAKNSTQNLTADVEFAQLCPEIIIR